MSRPRTSSGVAFVTIGLALSACVDATAPLPASVAASQPAVADARERLIPAITNAGSRARILAAIDQLDAALRRGNDSDARASLANARAELAQANQAKWIGAAESDAISIALSAAAESLELDPTR